MAALHAAVTAHAVPDVHIETPHDRLHDRQLFVVLHRDACAPEPPAAHRTHGRQRHGVPFVNGGWHRPMRVTTVTPPGASATGSRGGCWGALRERGGLSLRRAAREIEFLLQSFILAAQPFVLALDAFALLAFSIPLTFRALRTFAPLPVGSRLIVGALEHATLMADSWKLYKYEILDCWSICAARGSGPANQIRSRLTPQWLPTGVQPP